MRTAIIVIIATLPAFAQAQSNDQPRSDKTIGASNVLPLKKPSRGNPCAEYGAGFMRLEGSDTCVRVGGAVRVDSGTTIRGR